MVSNRRYPEDEPFCSLLTVSQKKTRRFQRLHWIFSPKISVDLKDPTNCFFFGQKLMQISRTRISLRCRTPDAVVVVFRRSSVKKNSVLLFYFVLRSTEILRWRRICFSYLKTTELWMEIICNYLIPTSVCGWRKGLCFLVFGDMNRKFTYSSCVIHVANPKRSYKMYSDFLQP
jgi:hypothetical protein